MKTRRDYYYLKRYGITALEADRMKEKGCAICGDAAYAIDHCHETGRVRGALCHACNTALGWFRDDPVRMHSAIMYLTNP